MLNAASGLCRRAGATNGGQKRLSTRLGGFGGGLALLGRVTQLRDRVMCFLPTTTTTSHPPYHPAQARIRPRKGFGPRYFTKLSLVVSFLVDVSEARPTLEALLGPHRRHVPGKQHHRSFWACAAGGVKADGADWREDPRLSCSLPSLGEDSLKTVKTLNSSGLGRNRLCSKTANSFYKTFAIGCSRAQVASLANLPHHTTGQTYYYPGRYWPCQIPPPALEYRVQPELAKRFIQIDQRSWKFSALFLDTARLPDNWKTFRDLCLTSTISNLDLYYDWVAEVRRETLGGNFTTWYMRSSPTPLGQVSMSSSKVQRLLWRSCDKGGDRRWMRSSRNCSGRNISFSVCSRHQQIRVGPPPGRQMYSGLGFRSQSSSGPTDEVTVDGLCMWDGHSEYAYWDDYLTDQEIDLICGVYHISTGQRDPGALSGEQTTARSWWPRPSAMEQSGLNVGWWTPLCE
ncbi:hypothetical protein B0H14DRAFT_2599192 [Mycena olivaceomarginata]|nr:hypothetical protein B0H14DRAFT_2599192 [Mycena olivaceomarginata]